MFLWLVIFSLTKFYVQIEVIIEIIFYICVCVCIYIHNVKESMGLLLII